MKTTIKYVFWAVAIFVLSFVSYIALTIIFSMVLRSIIPPGSIGEACWMTLVSYVVPIAWSMAKITFDSGEAKRLYLKHIENSTWSLKDSVLYNLNNRQTLVTVAVIAVLSIIVLPMCRPSAYIMIFVLPFLRVVPIFLPAILSYALPFFVLYLLTLSLIQRSWAEKRLHFASKDGV